LARGDEKGKGKFNQVEENAVEQSLREVFAGKGWDLRNSADVEKGEEILLSDLARALKKKGSTGANLAEGLYKYHGDGRYARFFDQKDAMDFSREQFVVFDLQGLNEYTDLLGPLLLAIMGKVNRVMQNPELADSRKVLVSDEAWALLKDPDSAAFIELFSRTARKNNGVLICISQSLMDWMDNPAGKVILTNSSNKIYLRQQKETLRQVAREFGLSKEEIEAIASLRTVNGRYSEFFATTDDGEGVLRYVPSPFEYWTFTTDPPDIQALEEAILECKGDQVKAIRLCAKRHPNGASAK